MNFRSRIITTFLSFAAILTLIFGVLLDGLMTFVEDEISRDFLSENMAYFVKALENESSEDILIDTPKVKAYLTKFNDTPKELIALQDGFHETSSSHVLVKTLESGFYAGETLILQFIESKSFLDQHENTIILTIILFSLLIVFLAAIVCLYLAKSIASPIEYLAKNMNSELGDISGSTVLSRKDELGSLARAFAISVARIQDLLEREKNFNRYASHELRTPLTVVKNNVDILQVVVERLTKDHSNLTQNIPKAHDNAIKRLKHAIWFMEQQINTLLLLARGEYKPHIDEVELHTLLEDIEAYFPDLNLNKVFNKNTLISADITVLLGILINILNNVIEHGTDDDGTATATLQADHTGFSVSNPASSTHKNNAGKRFGLEIVKQLCDAMNWHISLNELDTEFRVSIRYEDLRPE